MSKTYVNMGCNDSGSTGGCEEINIFSTDNSILVSKITPCDFDIKAAPAPSAGYGDVQARLAISATYPLTYNSTTGILGILEANGAQAGYLSTLDYQYFDSKIDNVNSTGTGVSIVRGVTSKVINLKSIKAGSGISITVGLDDITINAASGSFLEADTLATVVARGGITGQPISVQKLTISGIPATGLDTDDVLVRSITGEVKYLPASTFIPPPPINLDLPIRDVIADDVVQIDDFTMLVDTTFGDIDITFDPVLYPKRVVVIKKVSSDANLVHIIPASGTIDGYPDYSFDISGKPVMVQSNGTNLYIIGG